MQRASLIFILLVTYSYTRQASPIHIWYGGGPYSEFAVTMAAHAMPSGTYWCAMGYNDSYTGMQFTPQGHNFIFSTWNTSAGNAEIIWHDPHVQASGFDGEGSGGKTICFEQGFCSWNANQQITFHVKATQYGGNSTKLEMRFKKDNQWHPFATHIRHDANPN